MKFCKILKKIAFFLACLINLSTSIWAADSYKYDIALCAIFQNEASYLQEWIEFHKIVGVQHFYLYNNKSTDNYRMVLDPYIKAGEVDLIEWKYTTNSDGGNWPTIQMMAYNNVLELTRNNVKWLVVIDTDEFLFPVQVDTLQTFLSDFEGYAAVSVNWQMYGTSNVKKAVEKRSSY